MGRSCEERCAATVYFAVLWKFGDDWYEAWVPDVGGAAVIASTEEEVLAEIRGPMFESSTRPRPLPAPSLSAPSSTSPPPLWDPAVRR
ncbi:hypothetical protein HYH03_003572 [Edaphochlamys debaryana]|uniref:Uncharacterized protein n=1 Tax=Edaphochlamys debaryana TaxID=47281 RepID=A0A836C2R8_9CHLO|nr:hypothetical protein HYH03_003572 [Edaphochlamys debaryana]|eukprot:KAG2498311.1 hypothetical protein HYH03_003572 [Edaphochlamys debaryana]